LKWGNCTKQTTLLAKLPYNRLQNMNFSSFVGFIAAVWPKSKGKYQLLMHKMLLVGFQAEMGPFDYYLLKFKGKITQI